MPLAVANSICRPEEFRRFARERLADLFWGQFLREEKAGDEGQRLYFEGLVRQFNDGQYDARLKGDGTLAITTDPPKAAVTTLGRSSGNR